MTDGSPPHPPSQRHDARRRVVGAGRVNTVGGGGDEAVNLSQRGVRLVWPRCQPVINQHPRPAALPGPQ